MPRHCPTYCICTYLPLQVHDDRARPFNFGEEGGGVKSYWSSIGRGGGDFICPYARLGFLVQFSLPLVILVLETVFREGQYRVVASWIRNTQTANPINTLTAKLHQVNRAVHGDINKWPLSQGQILIFRHFHLMWCSFLAQVLRSRCSL